MNLRNYLPSYISPQLQEYFPRENVHFKDVIGLMTK